MLLIIFSIKGLLFSHLDGVQILRRILLKTLNIIIAYGKV